MDGRRYMTSPLWLSARKEVESIDILDICCSLIDTGQVPTSPPIPAKHINPIFIPSHSYLFPIRIFSLENSVKRSLISLVSLSDSS